MEYIGEITNYGNGPNPVILTHEHTNEVTYQLARLDSFIRSRRIYINYEFEQVSERSDKENLAKLKKIL